MFYRFIFLAFFVFFFGAKAAENSEEILFESLLASVSNNMVMLSDIQRFHEVESIMICSGLRNEQGKTNELLPKILNRYLDEELLYVAAIAKKQEISNNFQQAIQKIQSKELCSERWRKLGKSYGRIWGSNRKLRGGQVQLLRELEKRLLIDLFAEKSLKVNKENWLRETKLKTPIQLFIQ